MMQMLRAGGIQPMTDEVRQPDLHNSNGYLEFERVRHLAADNTWLSQVRGMALKVIVQLVPFLPTGNQYRFLFVQRDINEIIQSQESMLVSLGSPPLAIKDLEPILIGMFQGAIEFAEHHPDTRFEVIEHRKLISLPFESARQIVTFLGRADLDLSAMAGAVDPRLHRNRGISECCGTIPITG